MVEAAEEVMIAVCRATLGLAVLGGLADFAHLLGRSTAHCAFVVRVRVSGKGGALRRKRPEALEVQSPGHGRDGIPPPDSSN
jgi:hypothetical protein